MTSLKLKNSEIKNLEEEIKYLEVTNVPLNFNEKIDEGAYASIFKFPLRNKTSAVKLFKQQLSKKKILQVSIKLRQLQSVNIVRFRGYSVRPTALFLELCEVVVGDEIVNNVKQLITLFNENRNFDVLERSIYMLQSAQGLKFLHENNVIHRDFKPTNLLVTGTLDNIVVKVADFDDFVDIKNTITSTITSTKHTKVGTTLSYLAPELILGHSIVGTMKSDIYSWAISFFEVLSSHEGSPWVKVLPTANDQLLIKAIMDKKRPPIQMLNVIYPNCWIERIISIIRNAWKDDVKSRLDLNKIITLLKNLIDEGNIVEERLTKYDDVSEKRTTEELVINKEKSLEKLHGSCLPDQSVHFAVEQRPTVFESPPCSSQDKKVMTRSARGKTTTDGNKVALSYIKMQCDPSYIEKVLIDNVIGCGVFPRRLIVKGEFIATYCGDVLTHQEGEERLLDVSDGSERTFLFFFHFKNKKLCIDATHSNRIGRYINDAKNANCHIKVVEIDGLPHLCIFAITDVPADTELRYDYGASGLFWRKEAKYKKYRKPLNRADLGQFCDEVDKDLECMPPSPQNIIKQSLVFTAGGLGDICHFDDKKTDRNDNNGDAKVDLVADNNEMKSENITLQQDVLQVVDCMIATIEVNLENDVDVGSAAPNSGIRNQIMNINDSGFDIDSDIAISDTDDELSEIEVDFGNVDTQGANTSTNQQAIDSDIAISDIDNELSEIDADFGNVDKLGANTTINQQSKRKPDKKKKLDNPSKKSSKRPLRKCIFCGAMRCKLTRHLKMKHGKEPRVANAMKLTTKEQHKEFKSMRWEGIDDYNKEEIQRNPENPKLQGERALRKSKEYVKCSVCNFFGARKYFFSHKKQCSRKNDQPAMALPVMSPKLVQDNRLITVEFQSRILAKFRLDNLGNICKKDEIILMIGSKLFNKLKFKKEKTANVDRSVRADMRLLANIYDAFKSVVDIKLIHGNFADLFRSENFDQVCVAIDMVTFDDTKKAVKPGLRSNIFYLMKKAAKYIQLYGYIKSKENIVEDVTRFLRCFNASEDDLVCGARYILEQNRLKNNRKPCNLPLEEDVHKVNKYMTEQMETLLSEYHFWDSKSYIALRNIICARLTLVNGRRGGEIGRMLMEEWEEAEKDGWIDPQRLKQLSESDKERVKALKITYMAGKGNHHVVSVFIPDDCIKALKKISDPEIRREAGILPGNKFLFATQSSDIYLSGWHILKDVIGKVVGLKRPDLINGTNNRHRLSTIFASLNMAKDVRDAFYTHMGHSEEMNKNIYQTPMALMGITTYGNQLMQIDQGEYSRNNLQEESQRSEPLVILDEHSRNPLQEGQRKAPFVMKKRSYKHEIFTDSSDESQSEFESELSDIEEPAAKQPRQNKEYATRSGQFIDQSIKQPIAQPTEQQTLSLDNNQDYSYNDLKNRRSAKWTPKLHSAVLKEFAPYIRRTEGYQPMPDSKQMDDFIRKYHCTFNKFTVRTKINNERAKHDRLVNEKLKATGMVAGNP